ncbi:unnamed protein product, partial [Didymodactylos carnosus]
KEYKFKHTTEAMYHQNPSVEAVPASLQSLTAMKNNRWFFAVPLIALCCVGIFGLLLLATVVLALIPVYLPKRGHVVLANQTSATIYLEYTIINGERKREIREKRDYSDDSKTSSTEEEKQNTANQISYAYNYESNQAKIVVGNMIFLSSFVIPFQLAYTPLCRTQACQKQLQDRTVQRFRSGIGSQILFTFTDDNGHLFTFRAQLVTVYPPTINDQSITTAKSSG